jgi:hypothetical protein
MVLNRTKFFSSLLQRGRGCRVNTAGIDGDRNDWAALGFFQPGYAKRGIKAARKRQKNGR